MLFKFGWDMKVRVKTNLLLSQCAQQLAARWWHSCQKPIRLGTLAQGQQFGYTKQEISSLWALPTMDSGSIKSWSHNLIGKERSSWPLGNVPLMWDQKMLISLQSTVFDQSICTKKESGWSVTSVCQKCQEILNSEIMEASIWHSRIGKGLHWTITVSQLFSPWISGNWKEQTLSDSRLARLIKAQLSQEFLYNEQGTMSRWRGMPNPLFRRGWTQPWGRPGSWRSFGAD